METFLLALLVAAQDPQAQPPEQAKTPDKMECRAVKGTGSRLRSGKVCLPASQWSERTKEDQKALKDMQDRLHCARNMC